MINFKKVFQFISLSALLTACYKDPPIPPVQDKPWKCTTTVFEAKGFDSDAQDHGYGYDVSENAAAIDALNDCNRRNSDVVNSPCKLSECVNQITGEH